MLKNRVSLIGLYAVIAVLFGASYNVSSTNSAEAAFETSSWFIYKKDGKPVGSWHIVEKNESANAPKILFEHRLTVKTTEGVVVVEAKFHTKNDKYYTPEKIEIIEKSGGKESVTKLVFEKATTNGKKITVIKRTKNGKTKTMEGAPDIVADWLLFHMVPGMPFKKGEVLRFSQFDMSRARLGNGNSSIKYHGLEKELSTKKKLHRFSLMEGKRVAADYWVNENRKLVRFKSGSEELVRATKVEAEKILKDTIASQWYQWSIKGKPVGYLSILKTKSEMKNAPILFEHKIHIRVEKSEININLKTYSMDNKHYYPMKIISDGRGEEASSFTAEFEKQNSDSGSLGKLKITRGKTKETYIDMPKDVSTDFVLFSIVENLPFKKGIVFSFNLLESTELNLKKNHSIKYIGLDETRNLHHFIQKGEGSSPAHYWVNNDHKLIRALWDGNKEFLLSTESEIKKATGKIN